MIIRNVVKQTVQPTVATTGYSASIELDSKFGRTGRILKIIRRLDDVLDKATSDVVIISDGEPDVSTVADIGAGTTDNAKAYESSPVTSAGGSTTVAELIENIADNGGAFYCLPTNAAKLKLAINVTAAAGGGASSKFYVTVVAEVFQ